MSPDGKPPMRPIVQMVSPSPTSRAGRLNLVDWGNGVASAATKSGLIAAILAALETVDLKSLSAWQAFGVSFAVLVATTLLRLYSTGPQQECPPSTPDSPAPDPDASISAKTAA